MYQDINYDVRAPVAIITMNRPDALNAFTGRMLAEIRHALASAERDPDVVGMVLTGAGRGFCAGMDMNALNQMSSGADEGGDDLSELAASPGDRATGFRADPRRPGRPESRTEGRPECPSRECTTRGDRARRRRELSVTRWLVLPLGFVLVAAAGYALLSAAPSPRHAVPAATRASAGGERDEIDDASRAKLRALLREADREESSSSTASRAEGAP